MKKESSKAEKPTSSRLTRREFMRSGSGVGVGLIVTSKTALGQAGGAGRDSDMHIALIGCGAQGTVLMNSTRPIEGVKFKAVCDIWDYNRNIMRKRLKAYKHPVTEDNAYERAEEMFEKEKNIDAVLVATPDFVHHTYAVMAMKAGYDCYCEKMMSNEIEYAKEMVLGQRETGKLLQIGHQRRSNPRYIHARNEVLHGNKLLGWITHAYAQWNRGISSSTPLGFPKKYPMEEAKLTEYGYKDMNEFRNWRMYKKYGGGAISDLGAHQIDLFNWMFNTTPKSVVASGGIDYYSEYEHYDNVMCIYDYDVPNSTWGTEEKAQKDENGNTKDHVTSRAYYQVLTTNSSETFYEKFLGENGAMAINETAAKNDVWREAHAPEWQDFAKKSPPVVTKEGMIAEPEPVYHKFWQHPKPWTRPTPWLASKNLVDVRATKGLDPWVLPITLDKLAHTPHLENFFDVVRSGGKQEDLNCPVEDGYKTAVTVLKVNEAVQTGERVHFKPEDFLVEEA